MDEYFAIVDALHKQFDASKSEKEREQLLGLSGLVMEIGESSRGIDWS